MNRDRLFTCYRALPRELICFGAAFSSAKDGHEANETSPAHAVRWERDVQELAILGVELGL